jgi:hypothetical protein
MAKRCIDPARVPCEKARGYLQKRGLLCSELKQPHPKPKKRGWFQEWFG